MPNTIQPPKDPRHQRFAELYANGTTMVKAYQNAGYKVSATTASANATRLLKRPDIKRYIDALRAEATKVSHLSITEILTFCARAVRTGIGDLDASPKSPTGDLIKSFSLNESEMGSSQKIEKIDPYKAIEIHLKLSGHDPETNALKEIANALAAIGTGPLPTEKM